MFGMQNRMAPIVSYRRRRDMRQAMILACAKLGERLFEARDRAGLTLRELGQMSGISWSSISAIERGKHSATAETIERLAVALGVRPCWLAFGERCERNRRRSQPKHPHTLGV